MDCGQFVPSAVNHNVSIISLLDVVKVGGPVAEVLLGGTLWAGKSCRPEEFWDPERGMAPWPRLHGRDLLKSQNGEIFSATAME